MLRYVLLIVFICFFSMSSLATPRMFFDLARRIIVPVTRLVKEKRRHFEHSITESKVAEWSLISLTGYAGVAAGYHLGLEWYKDDL